MKRIRTIPGAVEEIRKTDPETIVTEWLLRSWVKKKLIPVVPTGCRALYVDMDKVEAFLNGDPVT